MALILPGTAQVHKGGGVKLGALAAGGAALVKSGALSKGCSAAGGAAVKSGAAGKLVAGTAGISGGKASIEAAGRGLLRTQTRTELLGNKSLMNAVPELEDALNKGIPIEKIIAEHPEIPGKIGTHIATSDRGDLVKLIINDFEASKITHPSLTPEILEIKNSLSQSAQKAVNALQKGVSRHRHVNEEILNKEILRLPQLSGETDRISAKVDGLFVEIKVNRGLYTFVAQIDVAAFAATGATTAISVKTVQNDFYKTEKKSKSSKPIEIE